MAAPYRVLQPAAPYPLVQPAGGHVISTGQQYVLPVAGQTRVVVQPAIIRPAEPAVVKDASGPEKTATMQCKCQDFVWAPCHVLTHISSCIVWTPCHVLTNMSRCIFRCCKGRPHRKILCYGDSNTFGFRGSPPGKKPYGLELERILNERGFPCEVKTCGNCGFTAKRLWETKDQYEVQGSGGQHGLVRLLNEFEPDLAIIMLGTNGLNTGQEVAEILEYTTKLHEYCHEHGVKTMALAGIMPNPQSGRFGLVSKYHDMAQQLSDFESEDDYEDDNCVGFADPEELVARDMPGMYDSDNMHFSQDGLDFLAKQLAPKVMDSLDKF